MTPLEEKFYGLLHAAIKNQCSDIHISTGLPPAYRSAQGVLKLNTPAFTLEEMKVICQFMISDPEVKSKIEEIEDLDGSFEIKNLCRFRYNIFRSASGLCVVLRVIKGAVPTLKALKTPPIIQKISDAERGLVLVTGATGSGKSTTLAAMIDYINTTKSLHILTIEDPIEFLHPQKLCHMTQREVGRDTRTFAKALKSALRQDPDIILVGEMRDYETLDIALKAAETGHLVFTTAHTQDTMKTIARLVSLFPKEEQAIARLRLADNIHAIISQRLVEGKKGEKVLAQEVLVNNFAIRECIAHENKTSEIPTFLAHGFEVGSSQTFDQHLGALVKNGTITMEAAMTACSNPNDFRHNFEFGTNGAGTISTEVAEEKTKTKVEAALEEFSSESIAIDELSLAVDEILPTLELESKVNIPRPSAAAPSGGTKSVPTRTMSVVTKSMPSIPTAGTGSSRAIPPPPGTGTANKIPPPTPAAMLKKPKPPGAA